MRVLACLGHEKEKSLLGVTDLLDVQGNQASLSSDVFSEAHEPEVKFLRS